MLHSEDGAEVYMVLTETEVTERIESPLNLLNRLRSVTKSDSPSLPPTSDEIIEDLHTKLNYGALRTKAADIMSKAMKELDSRIGEVSRPEKLATIVADMGKIVNSQQDREKGNTNNIGQVVIYCPETKKEEDYNIIDISRNE